uniref:Uncharacterized protein n=1 Tax=Arundo donax TaxID=35708 RepID=A0A0A8YH45_ARUDO
MLGLVERSADSSKESVCSATIGVFSEITSSVLREYSMDFSMATVVRSILQERWTKDPSSSDSSMTRRFFISYRAFSTADCCLAESLVLDRLIG